MKHTIARLIAISVLLGAVCFAQTAVSLTTLGAAITTPNATTITLTSTTGMSNSGPANQINTVIYVDQELMWVTTVIDGTHLLVQRGKGQTRPMLHASGANVIFGPPVGNFFSNVPISAETWGACTASNELYLQKVYASTGDILDCKRTGAAGTSGQWIKVAQGTMAVSGQQVTAFCTGTVGSGALDYLNGAACSTSTGETARQVISSSGTVANLYAYSSAVVVAGGSDAVTVRKNGSNTALTCTMAAGATTCTDTTHSFSVVPGDVLTFNFQATASDTAANIAVGVGVY